MFTAASATLALLASSPASPAPEAEFVIVAGGRLAQDTGRLLTALEAEGRLDVRSSSVDFESFAHCLGEDHELTEAQRACVRAAAAARRPEVPVVAIVVSYTRARGAWQHMECIGPRTFGVRGHVYVRDFDHPRPDVGPRVRAEVLGCVTEALG